MSKITLATLPQASLQDIFTQVKNHLLKQKQRSMKKSLIIRYCAYRSDNGLSCAFGCLIADEEYKIEMDDIRIIINGVYKGTSINSNINKGYFPKLTIEKLHLCIELQEIHDNNFPDIWDLKLMQVAKQFNLEY